MPTPNRDQIERITRRQVFQRPHNAGLDHGFGEYGGDGIGEALEAIDDGEHDILSAAVPISFMTRSQNSAPSFCSTHMPSTSLPPLARTPNAMWIALERTMPSSRIFTRIASKKTSG